MPLMLSARSWSLDEVGGRNVRMKINRVLEKLRRNAELRKGDTKESQTSRHRMETLRRKGGVSFEISVQFGKLETGFTQGKARA